MTKQQTLSKKSFEYSRSDYLPVHEQLQMCKAYEAGYKQAVTDVIEIMTTINTDPTKAGPILPQIRELVE